nr:uncharacterized protein LOC109152160 [Ipomoea trifida]
MASISKTTPDIENQYAAISLLDDDDLELSLEEGNFTDDYAEKTYTLVGKLLSDCPHGNDVSKANYSVYSPLEYDGDVSIAWHESYVSHDLSEVEGIHHFMA